MKAIGKAAGDFLSGLAEARGDGNSRQVGATHLDSVKAWERTDPAQPIIHKADGSEVEVVYRAYLKPTKRQLEQSASAKAAGVPLDLVKGRLVDIRCQKNGDILVLVTNGLRAANGEMPLRSLNVTKGKVLGISVDEPLGMTVDQVRDQVALEEAALPHYPAQSPTKLRVKVAPASQAPKLTLPAGPVVPMLPSGSIPQAQFEKVLEEAAEKVGMSVTEFMKTLGRLMKMEMEKRGVK